MAKLKQGDAGVYDRKASSPTAASNRHTRITRGQGPTAANPAPAIRAKRHAGGLKGPARS